MKRHLRTLPGRAMPLAVFLIAGWFHSMWAFAMGLPATVWVLIFPVASLGGAMILLDRQAYLAAAMIALSALTATYFIVISTVDPAAVVIGFDRFVRRGVFTEPLKSQATQAMLSFTTLLTLVTLFRPPARWQSYPIGGEERRFVQITYVPAILGAVGLGLFTARGPWIMDKPYGYVYEGYTHYAGLEAAWTFLVIFPVIAAVRLYGPRDGRFYFALGAAIALAITTRLLRGERASVAGLMVVFIALYHMVSTRRYKMIYIATAAVFGLALLQVWAYVRALAPDMGLVDAFQAGIDHNTKVIATASLTRIDRMPAAYWNMLDTIDLYGAGVRRNGATYLNLIGQSVPHAVADVIGYERPLSEPWMLARYRPHAGGIFMVAEAYWNFGIVGVNLLAAGLGMLTVGIENAYRRLPPITAFGYFGGVVLLLVGLFVGVQAFARGLELMIAFTGLVWFAVREPRRTQSPTASQNGSAFAADHRIRVELDLKSIQQ